MRVCIVIKLDLNTTAIDPQKDIKQTLDVFVENVRKELLVFQPKATVRVGTVEDIFGEQVN